jgi:hypothetical protein
VQKSAFSTIFLVGSEQQQSMVFGSNQICEDWLGTLKMKFRKTLLQFDPIRIGVSPPIFIFGQDTELKEMEFQDFPSRESSMSYFVRKSTLAP